MLAEDAAYGAHCARSALLERGLLAEHGDAFEEVKTRTSVVPFKAIAEGRQLLPAVRPQPASAKVYLTVDMYSQ